MWEHFILESCMKLALKKLAEDPYTGDCAVIFNYLKSINQTELDVISSISQFFSSMVELIMPAIEIMGVKINTGSGEKIREYYDSKHNYKEAVNSLYSLLINENFSILFLIDDIDENLTKKSNERIVEDFVRQLLKVITKLNYEFINNPPPIISIKAFIPTDIYSWLDLRHEDKFRSNKYELRWTDEEMRAMFRNRLSELCRLGKTPFDSIMKIYFGDYIYDIYGNKRDIFTYMIENTFGRPRDIMNLYKQLKFVLGGHSITTDAAYNAISDYISETVDTIIKEYSFAQPHLYDVINEFTKSDSLCNWEYIRVRVAEKAGAALPIKDVENVISTLYEISLFGVFIDAPKKPLPPIHSLDVEYCYDRRRKSLKRLNFVMHPIFRYEYLMRDNSKDYIKEMRKQN